MQALGKAADAEAAYVFSAVMSISGSMALPVSSFPNMGAASCLVERLDRRGTEPFELFRSEFGQNSFKIQEFSLENSKISENEIQHFLKYRQNSDKISSKSVQESPRRIQK